MILDTSGIADGSELWADVCIIGAGAAGISAALSLRDAGLEVLLLESGGNREESDTQALYAGHVTDEALHPPLTRYRQRRFGGSTTIWGGRCMPFDPIDFEQRSYIQNSGWPITRGDLDRYYEEANRLCEAGDFSYTAGTAFPGGMKPMLFGFESPYFATDQLERISCPTDFGARYAHRIGNSQTVRVVLHANITELGLDDAGSQVERAVIKTLGGKQFTARAKWFVLAAGGLEVTRILLSSPELQKRQIGNLGDALGRYYMCHLAGVIGKVHIAPHALGWHGYELSSEGVYCRRRFSLTESAQRSLGAGNFIGRLNFLPAADPEHRNGFLSLLYLARWLVPYEYGKRLHGYQHTSLSEWAQHLSNVLIDSLGVVGFGWHILRDRILAERKFPSLIFPSPGGVFSLDFHAEQCPIPESRVLLAEDTDVLGMRRIKVDWRYSQQDVSGIRASLRLLADELERTGVGRFEFRDEEVEAEMTRYGAYGGHHIGTTRMSVNPMHGVVDTECRVHGAPNLYVASSSVFPTSSQANPTLTIIAIALRVAAHIRRSAHAQEVALTAISQIEEAA